MVQHAAGATGPVGPREVALIDGISDERVVVASANARLEATIAKSDLLLDDDSSARAKRTREKALAEEARRRESKGGEAYCMTRQATSCES